MKILLTADVHLRGDAPSCRKHPEKWLDEQAQSFEQIIDMQDLVDEVWIIGDLFHRSRTSTEATVQALNLMSRFDIPVRVLLGNHDLYGHNPDERDRSTIGAIFSLPNVRELLSHIQIYQSDANTDLLVEAYPFGSEPEQIPHCDIWCTHQLVFPDDASRPIPELGAIAEDLLKRSDAKVIITGDYHHGYVKEFDGRKVITCGCVNIQARDMADYKPHVYILDTETLDVKEEPLKVFGELDLETPLLEDANGYAETLQIAHLPKIDFREAIDKATEEVDEDVRDKVGEILLTWDSSKIV